MTYMNNDKKPTAAMETDALLLQVRGSTTSFQLFWDKLTLPLKSSSDW